MRKLGIDTSVEDTITWNDLTISMVPQGYYSAVHVKKHAPCFGLDKLSNDNTVSTRGAANHLILKQLMMRTPGALP